jgi:hypothetical protein
MAVPAVKIPNSGSIISLYMFGSFRLRQVRRSRGGVNQLVLAVLRIFTHALHCPCAVLFGVPRQLRMEVSYNTSTGARCLPPAVTRFACIGRQLAGGLAAQRCLCSPRA